MDRCNYTQNAMQSDFKAADKRCNEIVTSDCFFLGHPFCAVVSFVRCLSMKWHVSNGKFVNNQH
jgi:hypothetical protein